MTAPDRDRLANRVSGDALVPILAAVIGALDGVPCPQNYLLGRLSGLTVSQIDTALARGIATGKLRRDVRKRSRRLVVMGADGDARLATGWSRAGGNRLLPAVGERAKAAARAAGGVPADDGGHVPIPARSFDDVPRVNRTRCPRCNLPPDHIECRHGWNGITTRMERRAIAMEAAA